MGDLNAYAMEDPIDVLKDAGYVDQAGPDEYAYLFDDRRGPWTTCWPAAR